MSISERIALASALVSWRFTLAKRLARRGIVALLSGSDDGAVFS